MSYKAELLTLVDAFKTGWALTPYAAMKFEYPNQAGFKIPAPDTAWGRFSILRGIGQRADFGTIDNQRWRHATVVDVTFFEVLEGGSAVALDHVDAALAIFRKYNSNGIRAYRTDVKEHGTKLDPAWWCVTGSVFFERDTLF
jgi:hypothetical protein